MLPEQIELPGPEDFCRGRMFNAKGQSCFLGWKLALFTKLSGKEDMNFHQYARDVATEMKLKHGGITIPLCNDTTQNTAQKLSKWFAKTVERMGYDIE